VKTFLCFIGFVIMVKLSFLICILGLFVLRFIADGMLGKLTRWLRMLGHDVDYYKAAEDKKLIFLADSENRILLTCDLELYQQAVTQGLDAVFVEALDAAQRLADLANRFGFKLEFNLCVSRCPKCNAELVTASKETILSKIPEATASYYDDFWRCMGCGQIYWQGAHWKRIQMTLDAANSRLRLL